MLQNTIEIATNRLVELYELVGRLEHKGEKGIFRELFISQLIRPLLPVQFGIGSGIVMDKNLKQSRQCDLIIYDRRLLPPILVSEGRGIFPIDSVLAVVEVKSTLKAAHCKQFSDAAHRLCSDGKHDDGLQIITPGKIERKNTHDLKATHVHENGSRPGGIFIPNKTGFDAVYPLYAVFAYTSTSKGGEIDRLNKKAPDHGNYVRLIGVLDKEVCWFNENNWVSEPEKNRNKNSARFLKYLLNRLTDTANSRGDYRLQYWIDY